MCIKILIKNIEISFSNVINDSTNTASYNWLRQLQSIKNVYVTTKINIALPITKAIVRRCPAKKLFLKVSGNWQKSICTEVFYLIKLQASSLSCECCKNFKNTYFVEHLRTAASAGMILQMNKCTVLVLPYITD